MGNSRTRLAKMGVEPLLSVLGSGAEGFVYGGKFNPNTYLELLQKMKSMSYAVHRQNIALWQK